ncbi:hypothetical protein [Rheinheimera soli]|uniref:Uncharacterized protein n=1 Tax=Rheinheimera soli TaxID=443616 RepID=A0ABU1VXL4_9GAMM|nr:hypothetical protein [Rheinheimera soli]MDR7120325.1 hypothetical protein [Rheinheimera soli]
MDFAVKFGLYFLGVLTSVLLIPTIEKKKAETHRKESIKEVFIELEDIHFELAEDLAANFNFLLNLRAEPELAGSGEIPIPMPKKINSEVLADLYKKSALLLTSPQRLEIKRIPSNLSQIEHHSELFLKEFTENGSYCVASMKNTIKLSCFLLHKLNFLLEHRERFNFAKDLTSNKAVFPVLISLGFTAEQIAISRIEESRFDNVKVKF